MRALVLTDFGHLDVQERPTPRPGPGEVLLRIAATGICGSDFHGFTGENGRRVPGQVMGHESAGTIAALGEDVSADTIPLGAPATFNPVVVPTADLEDFRGREQHHPGKTVIGVAPDVQASFADFVVVPARNIHLLPRDLPLHLGALVEPLAVALHAVRVAAPRPGTRTVVVGGGPIGQSIVLALRIEGVDQALLSEPSALRRELVESLGVRAVGPDGGPLHHQVREHFGAPADLALDAVGITPTLADALTCTRLGGTVVLVGMGSPQLTLPAFAISTEERTLTGSFTYTAEDFRDAADWLGAHPHEVAPLVSEQVPPEGAQNAFTRLSQGAPVAGKILVDFTAAADDVGSEGKAAS